MSMNCKFDDILKRHEKEDGGASVSEKVLIRNVERELKNGAEILALCKALNISLTRFFTDKDFPRVWPVMPVRQCSVLQVRKHTVSQRPYFHGHDFYELIYVHSGRCTQTLDGADGPRLTLEAGGVCLLNAGAVHAIESSGAGDVIIKVCIPRDIYGKCRPHILTWQTGESFKTFAANEQFDYFIFRLLEEQTAERECCLDAMAAYLSLLLIEAVRPPVFKDSLLETRLNEYLECNLQTASLKDFARITGYSEGYAGRMIKRGLNEIFSERLSRFRLGKAKELLRDTELCVEEIAFRVGYKNASGFYKQFAAFYGMTPKTYRDMFI